METGFSCTPLDPTLVNASGLALRGIQFDYQTPYSMSGNFTLQYQMTPSMSLPGWLRDHAGAPSGSVPQLQQRHPDPAWSTARRRVCAHSDFLPFPDFGQGASYATTNGNSYYHSLQTKVEKQFANGLNFLATYTWSKARTDAGDLLNGGSTADNNGSATGPRMFPGPEFTFDYGLASFDIRNVVHFSGGYELPFGKSKRFMGNSGWARECRARRLERELGRYSAGWPTDYASLSFSAPRRYRLLRPSWSRAESEDGMHIDSNGQPSCLGNPAAFTQPCVLAGHRVP